MTKTLHRESKNSTKWAVRGTLAALIALALGYLRCNGELGLGGGRGDSGDTLEVAAPPVVPAPGSLRCQLRLDGAGLWALGATGQQQIEVAAAVASCKVAGGADVVLTGEARQGAWDELHAALEAGGVTSFVRGAGAAISPTSPVAPEDPARRAGDRP
jgi:hypothetical protein